MESTIPAFVSHLAAKLERLAAERPDATDLDFAKEIVDDVDRLAVEVFELAA